LFKSENKRAPQLDDYVHDINDLQGTFCQNIICKREELLPILYFICGHHLISSQRFWSEKGSIQLIDDKIIREVVPVCNIIPKSTKRLVFIFINWLASDVAIHFVPALL
jgi:hypothetical protein